MKSIILVSLLALVVTGCKSAVEPAATDPAAAPSASVCVDGGAPEAAAEVAAEAAVVVDSGDAAVKADVKSVD